MANKKLSLNVIKNASAKEFPTKTVVIPVNGEDYTVVIDQIFKMTKIEKMISNHLKSDKVKKMATLEDEALKITYYMYLILKEFTNMDIPNNLKFEEELNLISQLIDLGIYSKIFEELPQSEIDKVNDFLKRFSASLNETLKENKLNLEELENAIEEKISEGEGNGK